MFAELAGCHTVWKEALRGWNVQQSKQVLEWQAEGRAKGWADTLLHLLQRRAGKEIPLDLVATIQNMTDVATLK